MTKPTSNLANSNVSLLSNSNEKASKLQNKIREQAKVDIFENLVKSPDLDKRKFTDIQKTMSEIKKLESGEIKEINAGFGLPRKYEKLKSKDPFKDFFNRLEKSKKDEKEKVYMEIAERIILNRGGVVEYKDGDKIGKDKITKDFVKNEYEILNGEYNNNLDFFTVKDKSGKLYIIKWKEEELKKIQERENELKGIEIEKLRNENEELKKVSNKVGGENNEELDKDDSRDSGGKDKEKMGKLIRELMEDSEAKDKKIEEQNIRITELENLLKNKNVKKTENTSENDTDINDEDTDTNVDDINKENNIDDDSGENSETLDENPNYISRSFVEGLVFGIRGAEGYPKGTIRIREEVINVEEFEFYEEFKQEYIEAKGDSTRLSKLDKEFAEMIILFSPKGADYENKYRIKLSEAELKDGLYVSDERLARYGVMIKVSEYFEKVVEREILRESIQKIETEIKELNVIIIELTEKLNIEKYSKEEILEVIKLKKIRLEELIKKQKRLLLSLRKKAKKTYIEKIIDDNENKDRFIEKFCDANGTDFKKYCTEHGITRLDGKEIDWKSGLDPQATFINKDGDLLKLKPHTGANSFDEEGDYDDYSSATRYDLLYVGKKKVREVIVNKERIILKEFDDSDYGVGFFNYCKENGITRKDGIEIPLKGGMDTSAIYIDKDGKEIKLERVEGANQHDDAGSHTKYELVYYKESENGEKSEIEIELESAIEEQRNLLAELTKLEVLLKKTGIEEERINIETKIKIIKKSLKIISQKITNIQRTLYKEKITIKNYKTFQIIPFNPTPNKPFEMNSVISDMGTDVFKEKAALKVEEELKRQYKSLGRWQMGSRLALFLGRGSKRKKMMRTEMNNMANTAFQTDPNYSTLNEQSQNAADRHGHELLTGMDAVNRLTSIHNKDIDQLCKDYLNNRVNDVYFQQKFNQIIANDNDDISSRRIQDILNGQNITHIGTNILLQLKERKALNTLITTLDGQINQYIATGNNVYMHNMQNYVEQYIKDYQKLPAFKATFEQFLKGDLNARNQLRRYLSHQKAIMNMQITNLRMNIDILNKGKSAYQIDNKDREKGWKYKVGHFMDKHPWGTAIGTVALSVGLGLATAPIGAVAGAAVTTGVFGSYVGFTNYIKKWTHHTKEQNTHEKNVVTDYRNEQAKIQNWQNLALNGKGRKKYKAKRQLALYDQTTQENIKLSNQIAEYITNLSAKSGPLTPKEANEYNFMQLNLIEGWARLKYYREMGHNFLASENVDKTEEDMRRLEKAITLGLQKIGKTTNDIETTMTATNGLGTNITYAVIRNDLKASYDKSMIQFKRERKNLALKYGISTAALSIGTALGLQWLTGSGVFAKDIPGTPGTPGTPSSTTSHAGGTDNFALGKDEILLPGELGYTANPAGIHDATVSAITGAPNGSTITFTYGVGTDATPVMAGHLTSTDLAAKMSSVSSSISGMSGLSGAQKASFLTELSSLSHSGFTNNNLATMRAAEYLQHCAQAMSDCGNSTLIPTFTRTLDVSGGTYNNLAERFMTGAIDITTPAIPGTPGIPGQEAVKRGRWFMGVPLFFNTFKDRKSKKDTTDQKFGSNAQGNQQPHNP